MTEATFAHQDDLPSLPVPSLDDTLAKFVQSVKPFLTEEELEHTSAVVEDFKAGVGGRLQKMLQERGREERNWLESWWEHFGYLAPRYPIAININWQGVLPNSWGSLSVAPSEAAAIYTRHILDFRQSLLSGTLPVELMGGQKLCMNQYTRMFNSCRVPGVDVDEIVIVSEPVRHIVVLHNNAVYSFDVLDAAGVALPYATIELQFSRVRAMGCMYMGGAGVEPEVSVLTSERRDNWAKSRDALRALDPCNVESLRVVETSLFVVAFDRGCTHDIEEMARLSLHGNGRNKWFDKPFNLIVFDNARVGVNGEHTWADALVVARMFNVVGAAIIKELRGVGFPARVSLSEAARVPNPAKLAWRLDSPLLEAVEAASAAMFRLTGTVDLRTLEFGHFGKGLMKRYRMVPDFFVQMAIQLAFYRVHKEVTATYETGHTRLFYHGRTDTIKATTTDSVAFVKAMCNDASSSQERFDLLKAAIATHSANARDVLTGKGVDRHLMGLNILSEMSGIKPRPALFTDKGYLEGKRYRLSTSNVSVGDSPIFGGFMAMYDDGYGVCYGLTETSMKFCVTCVATCKTTSSSVFRDALELSLLDMQRLCLARNVMHVGTSKL